MNRSTTIDNILNQVKHLDYSDRLNLIERLIKLLKKDNLKSDPSNKLMDLYGLGSEIWEGVNVENYINEQRQWD